MSRQHPVVGYDSGLIESVATALDLRPPNREALERVAVELSNTNGQPWSGVCDLATAVGKTYLAAGLIDYLSQSDAEIRHFLLVVPTNTVYAKTIENFSAGSKRSLLPMMTTQPVLIHPDNFNASWVAAEMEDPTSTKLFVFKIQQLIAPTEKVSRKTRDDDNENLGISLYRMLKELDDLVVLSDEHHLYAPKAKAFSKAINDLNAMCVVGLTATPDKVQKKEVIYHYPLARAIADKIVKTPCITGRTDDRSDLETRFRDAIVLLDAKQVAADQYAKAMNTHSVTPILLVVAADIEQADEVGERLRKEDLFNSDDAVLVVHSNLEDKDLEPLLAVEEPDSPVRAIVSVQMLGVGWDVKSVYVILSLRPSVSDALTEQTLGRGLRLPWGVYTDNEMLDTVEVLAHEKYKKLLENTDKILDGLVRDGTIDSARAEAARKRVEAKRKAEAYVQSQATSTTANGEDDTDTSDEASVTDVENSVKFADTESRLKEAQTASVAIDKDKVILPREDVTVSLPVVDTVIKPKMLNLSTLKTQEFTEIGRIVASKDKTTLRREVLNVKKKNGGIYLASTVAEQTISASQITLESGVVEKTIITAITGSDFVPSSKGNAGAMKRIAKAIIDGAGGEDMVAPELSGAIDLTLGRIHQAYTDLEPDMDNTVVLTVFAPVRANYRPVSTNRHGGFKTSEAYSGWVKGLHPVVWFDSKPERSAANIFEGDKDVVVWVRLEGGDTPVQWSSGIYQPDFYVSATDGTHWMLEVKADKDLSTDTVLRKKEAAEVWANVVSDEGLGDWKYGLLPESAVEGCNTFAQLLRRCR